MAATGYRATMPDQAGTIERMVVDALSSILDRSAPDAAPEPMLAEALGALFERHLVDEESWSRYAWIDDAQPHSTACPDASTVVMAGIATIVDGKRWSIQPFRAVFRLDPSRSRLEAFRLSLGDATADLHAVAYGSKQPRNWPDVPEWKFTFDRAGADLQG